MDCTVCNVRSSITYCNECQTLLCEECGAVCDECRKRMCPMHMHETRHGRTLCLTCFTDYTENRRRREAETEGVDLGAPPVEHHGRLKRSGKPLRPWLASLNMSLLGAAGIALLLFVPSLRQIDFGEGHGLPAAYIVLVLPLMAIAWAILGLLAPRTATKSRNLIGLSIALATIALTFLAVRPQSANFNLDFSDASSVKETERANRSREELKGWRKDMLERYEGENAPKPTTRQTMGLDEVVAPPSPR